MINFILTLLFEKKEVFLFSLDEQRSKLLKKMKKEE